MWAVVLADARHFHRDLCQEMEKSGRHWRYTFQMPWTVMDGEEGEQCDQVIRSKARLAQLLSSVGRELRLSRDRVN